MVQKLRHVKLAENTSPKQSIVGAFDVEELFVRDTRTRLDNVKSLHREVAEFVKLKHSLISATSKIHFAEY